MKISVIMPSFLGSYPNAATNRGRKFVRAVDSFLRQTYSNKELIIVSDGCPETGLIYMNKYRKQEGLILKKMQKQPLFSGAVRNKGLKTATGDIICYLDTDDFITETHLEKIVKYFEGDWVYYDDYLVNQFISFDDFTYSVRKTIVESCRIGTSSIAHRKGLDASWGDGYGHDWRFVKQLMQYEHKKIDCTGYMVCHQPKLRDV